MRNKGSMIDMFLIVAVFLVFGIVIVISAYLYNTMMPMLVSQFNNTDTTAVLTTVQTGFSSLDYVFTAGFFFLMSMPIIMAMLVGTHPIFIVINIILIAIFFLIAPIMSNVMLSIWKQDQFAPYAAGGSSAITFPIMTMIFKYLPVISIGISIVLMIAMFAGKRSDNL